MKSNLNNPVLVLNKSWQPIGIISVRNSISQVFRYFFYILGISRDKKPYFNYG